MKVEVRLIEAVAAVLEHAEDEAAPAFGVNSAVEEGAAVQLHDGPATSVIEDHEQWIVAGGVLYGAEETAGFSVPAAGKVTTVPCSQGAVSS